MHPSNGPKLFIDGVGFTDGSLAGVDLLSLDGRRAVRCSNATLPHAEVKRFLRMARWVYKAPLVYLKGGVSEIVFVSVCAYGLQIVHVHSRPTKNSLRFVPAWATQAENCTLVTSNLQLVSKKSRSWLQRSHAQLQRIPRKTMQRWQSEEVELLACHFNSNDMKALLIYLHGSYSCRIPHRSSSFYFFASVFSDRLAGSNPESTGGTYGEGSASSDPPLRKCQQDCLEACAKGARKIEMACGTGKTRVMKELVRNISGRVSCPVYEEPS